jgi:hypothetical protein
VQKLKDKNDAIQASIEYDEDIPKIVLDEIGGTSSNASSFFPFSGSLLTCSVDSSG